MGDLVVFPGQSQKTVTGKELQKILGVSQRWIRYRVAEGMPHSGIDYAGRRRFVVGEVIEWLDEHRRTA